MEAESLNILKVIVDYGALALFAALYYILFRWVLKHFEKEKSEYQKIISDGAEREKNFQAIITKLAEELPCIRDAVARIESKIQ